MRKELMDILVCPMCKGELSLTVSEETQAEVISGALNCYACQEDFPIEDSIPNLLPPDLRAT